MNTFNLNHLPYLTGTLLLSLTLSLFFNACKSKTKELAPSEEKAASPLISAKQKEAEKTIQDDPYVELVKAEEGSLHIQNKYTKRALILPFQQIIDGHYEIIRENEQLATRMTKMKEDQKKVAPPSQVLSKSEGWGNTPNWIPKYPNLSVSPSQLHSPLEDGSIQGFVTATHTDPVKDIKEFLITEFDKSGFTLTRNLVEKNSVIMIFENQISGEKQENRKVTCSVMRKSNQTLLTIQYSYGM